MVERGGSPRGYVSPPRALWPLQHIARPLACLYMWRSLPQHVLCSVGAEQSVEVELDARVDGERTVFAGEEVEGVVVLTNPLATPVVISWCRRVAHGSPITPNICPPVAYLCQLHVLLCLFIHSTLCPSAHITHLHCSTERKDQHLTRGSIQCALALQMYVFTQAQD